MSGRYILAIDQGTTSTRSILFDRGARAVAAAQAELPQHYPADGWVEHDAEDIWRDVLATAREVVGRVGADTVAAIGITNQRETAVVWDRATGVPIHRAIVWQDRRTADQCAMLRAAGHEPLVQARTGLLLDPYFSGTKLAWLLDHVRRRRARAEAGELAFGTIDSFLLWRLTGGRIHATDPTNASRTLLFDLREQVWDEELCGLLDVPMAVLPEVRDNAGAFGETDPGLFGRAIPIAGVAGDQQAALVGQGCFAPGATKATYGTGCFLLVNTGAQPLPSTNRLLATTAYRLAGAPCFALEGSIFVAGAAVKWLRDGLGLIAEAAETGALAASVPDNGGVFMVPGFTGLGAPHWRPDARGLLSGLTLATTRAHLARAALEAVAYQTADLLDATARDGAPRPVVLRVDGGMAASDWLLQFLANVLDAPVERRADLESTALGAAFLAGIGVGLWSGLDEVARLAGKAERFAPRMEAAERTALLDGWRGALARALA